MPLSHETHEVPRICPILASLDHSSKVRMAAAIDIKLSSTAKTAVNEKSRLVVDASGCQVMYALSPC